jgi:hypothetical protein
MRLGFLCVLVEDLSRNVLDVRDMDTYEIRKERVQAGMDDQTVDIESAYTKKGDYIGDPKTAKLLAKKGIEPEKSKPTNNVCSIGFNKKDGKWYGWSHRAMHGFKAGDEVEEGDVLAHRFPVGFKAKSEDDAKKMAIAFAGEVS